MAGTLLSYVKSLYGLPEHSDCDVRFYQGGLQGAPQHEAADTWLTAKIQGHLLVLAAHSERLRAQAANPWWPQQQQQQADNQPEPPTKKARTSNRGASSSHATQAAATTGSLPSSAPPGRPLLAVPLEGPHEVEPATHVIRFMYQGLPDDLSPQQLLMTRKLALYLLCTACADACAAALAAAPLSADDAYAACTNPHLACMLDDPAMSGFTDACVAALAKHFGSTLAVERSDDLKSKFLGLPLLVLQRLLAPDGSGQLPVDCEETVVVLLHRWVRHNNPPAAAVTRQLRKLVCLLQLGMVYLNYVLPRLKWLNLTPGEQSDLMYAAQALASAQLSTVAGVKAELKQHLSGTYANEPQWLDQRRSSTADAVSDTGVGQQEEETIRASWTRHELQALQQHEPRSNWVRACNGPWVYWRGFEWSIQVQVNAKAGDAAANAGAAAGSGAPAADAGLFLCNRWPAVLDQSKVKCIVHLSKFALQVDSAIEAAPVKCMTLGYAWTSEAGYGRCGYFSAGKGLDPSVWEPFLVEGVLRVRAVMTK